MIENLNVIRRAHLDFDLFQLKILYNTFNSLNSQQRNNRFYDKTTAKKPYWHSLEAEDLENFQKW